MAAAVAAAARRSSRRTVYRLLLALPFARVQGCQLDSRTGAATARIPSGSCPLEWRTGPEAAQMPADLLKGRLLER